MTKRLVVCLDGTWNTPDDKLNPTNVVKIMRAIRHTSDDGTKQITFYDKGVGTGGPIDRIRGGTFGRGLGDNVRDGYRFLANNYERGDEIYIFGFSRGAFTARSLAGFIGACGLLTKDTMGKLMRAWNLYRTPEMKRDEDEVRAIRELARSDLPIKCVGVWDTVGALGIPVERLKWINRGNYQFHDTTLGANIHCALHAIAIDEKRGPFAPTLWQTADHTEPQVVEQVWFPGVHSNIGGSYDDPGLSDLALDWMIKRVCKHTKLAFDDGYIPEHIRGKPLGTMYESRSPLYTVSRVLPYQRVLGGQDHWVRRFFPRTNRPDSGKAFVNEMIHQSALDRFGQVAPVQHGDKRWEEKYQPENLNAAQGKLPVVGYPGEVI